MISNFCCVLNVEFFLLCNYLASVFYMPTFRNTPSVPLGSAIRKNNPNVAQFFLATYYWPPLRGLCPLELVSLLGHVASPSPLLPNGSTISSRLFFLLTPPMKTEQTVYSKTSAYKIQTQGNPQKEEYKGKDVPVHAMNAYRGGYSSTSKLQYPLVLGPPRPIHQGFSGFDSQSWYFGLKKSLSQLGIKPLPPSPQPDHYTNTIFIFMTTATWNKRHQSITSCTS